MDRRDFLINAGVGLLTLSVFSVIESCTKNDFKVDFTLDLTDPNNSALNNNGGSVISNGVIIGRDLNGDFHAVAVACTHAGCNVKYQSTQNDFSCPCHGSLFDSSGKVLQGPAPAPLQQFNVTLSGTSLRVFS